MCISEPVLIVTGKFGTAEEDGKVPVDLKFVYVAIFTDVALTGKFDHKEKSQRGTSKFGPGTLIGDFVFKRNPDFVRFYPSPSTITPRKRWEFAITAILDKIRRCYWSPTYILQRIKDGKKYVEWSIRENHYGRNLSADEEKEYYNLFPTLLAGGRTILCIADHDQAGLCSNPVRSRRIISPQPPTHKYLRHSPIVCDICGDVLGGARVLCMDCRDKTTVDLRPGPECLRATSAFEKREEEGSERSTYAEPQHAQGTLYSLQCSLDTARAEMNAKDALEAARQTLSDLKAQKEPMPQCSHCKETASKSCWYCVDCTSEFRSMATVVIIAPVNVRPCRREVHLQ